VEGATKASDHMKFDEAPLCILTLWAAGLPSLSIQPLSLCDRVESPSGLGVHWNESFIMDDGWELTSKHKEEAFGQFWSAANISRNIPAVPIGCGAAWPAVLVDAHDLNKR
jgi:hypothetical protein